MTKIILLCLGAATLLAFAGAENERGDKSLAEISNLRALRAAEPASKCKNNDTKCKRKNGQKARRKKNKNKNKRNKNKRNKNRKSSRKQRLNRQGARNQKTEDSECLPKTCVATGVGYMKKNDMVRNFEAQKKRLDRFVKQANSKAKKSANFAPLIVKLTALGGGNSSNLLCNGNGTNSGAVLLKNLTAELGKCNVSITEECSTKSVVLNETTTASLEACLSTMLAFKNKLAEAGNKTLTESAVCAMYLKPELKELADNVNKTCMPTKLLAKAAKANSGCKDAYKACKGRLEDVNEVLSLCSPINSAESLKAAITSGVKNKEAGTKLQKKVATMVSARRLRRSTNASCSDFAEQVKQASAKLEQTPLMASLAAELDTLASTMVAACDQAAKDALTASNAKLVNGLTAIDKAIKEKKDALLQATGEVYVVTTPAPPASTTMNNTASKTTNIPVASTTMNNTANNTSAPTSTPAPASTATGPASTATTGAATTGAASTSATSATSASATSATSASATSATSASATSATSASATSASTAPAGRHRA